MVSENRVMNDSVGLTWLIDVFEKNTKDHTKGVYFLLIIDGHGRHPTTDFDLFYSRH